MKPGAGWAAALAAAALVAGCGGGDDSVGFEFRMRGQPASQAFRVHSDDAAFIRAARAQLALPPAERRRFVNGLVVRGGSGNPGWSWHLDDPELVEVTIELCDGTPSYLEANLDEWIRDVKRFCPWSSYVHAELR